MSGDRELGFMPAHALLEAYRRKTLSPVEATKAALARLERLEPKLNAFVLVDADGALAAARDSEARWAKGTPQGLVDGVPTTIKDIVLTKGWPTLRGSRLTKRDQAWTEDAPAVARLREHGAVFLGKTTTPEIGWKALGDSPLTGITRNPWNLAHTPGGSSAGAAAALAAGIGALAIGTDGGGSIRIPAAFCGVVGHKPSHGLVPVRPGFRGWPSLSVDGPLTHTVRDAALTLSVMAGPSPYDDRSVPYPLGDLLPAVTEPLDWSTLRVAVSEDLGWAPVEQSVRAAFRAAVDTLADGGARVVEAAPDAPYPTELWNDIALPEGYASEGPLLDRWGDQMTPGTREIVEAGRAASARDYLDALERRGDYARRWAEFFTGYDVLLTPSMPLPAFGTDVPSPASIDGVPVDPFFDDWCALALPANLTGCPATAVPTGLDPDGLPVGMQVMGPRGADARTLAVAAAYERLAPWADRRPGAVLPMES
jgi:aspartyl-tRNA(Asn)/glutamyl-tRNA(Gln) amidotransferase subunit A